MVFRDEWNKLGRRVVSASAIDAFKRRLDILVDSEVMWRLVGFTGSTL